MNLRKLVGTREFYKKVLFIAIPIILQNGITNFVGLLDNIMVGQVGTDQMSGVSIVNQLLFVFNLSIFGGISGAGIFTAQYYGKGSHEGVRQTFRFKMITCIFIAVIGLAVLIGFDEPLIDMFLHEGSATGNAEDTLRYGVDYLKVMLIGLVPFAINSAYTSTLRETGETVLPMKAGIAAVFVNLCLNYVLIFGHFGVPAMGVVGAAIATVISRYVECAIVIIWTHTHKERVPFIDGVYKSLYIPLPLVKQIIVKGMPLMINEFLWSVGMTLLTQCYSTRGLATVAALNISNTINNTFNVIYIALGSTVAIIVGQHLGANRMEDAKREDTQLIAFSVGSCFVVGAVLILIAPLFPQLYNTTDEVKEIAKNLIYVVAIMMPMNAFLHASYFTLRSGGKTVITFFFDSVFICCVSVPAAFVLAYYTNVPIITMFVMVQCIDLIKCVIGFVLVKKGVWLQNMVEE
ncbi:MAG: MATE family efflux transporter [Lachnospiraceae bacterium]|nr:MATE family efflux transporter [Lachnospiraceae bacterium]